MKMNLQYLVLFMIIMFMNINGKTYKVYYLGGQSNMDGLGKNVELPEELNKTFDNVFIFHGNTAKDGEEIDGRGIWSNLKPGHGWGFNSNGAENKYSELFGVEISFANELLKQNPEENIALIKYSRSGSSIANNAERFGCWDPDYDSLNGINQYDHFLATIRNAFAVDDIDNDGIKDTLIPSGILWMQGESDAGKEEIALMYESNLKRLMDLMRAALHYDDLPVVIGRITDSGNDEDGKVWNFADIVRKAQQSFVEKDRCAALITDTDNYGYSDKYHYDSAGFIDLGVKFAEAVIDLTNGKEKWKTETK